MLIFIIVFLVILGYFVGNAMANHEKKLCMRFGLDHDYDFLHLAKLRLFDGLNLPADTICEFLIHEEGVYIIAPNKTHKIDRKQVTSAYTITKEEIIEKSKSVIGRAALGGVLFGRLGATIGAISGVGNTSGKIAKEYLVITYNLGSEQDSVVVFAPKDASLTEESSINKCVKSINKNFFERSLESRDRKKRIANEEREKKQIKSNNLIDTIRHKYKEGIPYCKNCSSKQLIAKKRGVKLWYIIIPGIGILMAFIGRNKVILQCTNCGSSFKAGK